MKTYNFKDGVYLFIIKPKYNVHVYDLFRSESRKQIKVITKLPNSEQSYKGKVQTHKDGVYLFIIQNIITIIIVPVISTLYLF
jgi:hypothetical protein